MAKYIRIMAIPELGATDMWAYRGAWNIVIDVSRLVRVAADKNGENLVY